MLAADPATTPSVGTLTLMKDQRPHLLIPQLLFLHFSMPLGAAVSEEKSDRLCWRGREVELRGGAMKRGDILTKSNSF